MHVSDYSSIALCHVYSEKVLGLIASLNSSQQLFYSHGETSAHAQSVPNRLTDDLPQYN